MGRSKFIIGGVVILAAVIYLIVSATQANAEYFMTIDELKAQGQSVLGKNLRVSGAVIGDTIQYDPQTLTLSFEVAHVPGDNREVEAQGGLAAVLHAAVIDPNRNRIKVVYSGRETRSAQGRGPGHHDRATGFGWCLPCRRTACSSAQPSIRRRCQARPPDLPSCVPGGGNLERWS